MTKVSVWRGMHWLILGALASLPMAWFHKWYLFWHIKSLQWTNKYNKLHGQPMEAFRSFT